MTHKTTDSTILTPKRIDELIMIYRNGLLNDTLPFWVNHCVDREYGGFIFALDRDGTVVDTDKGMWQHGRFTWLLAHLYNTVEPREEWLELAKHGLDFIRRYGFDEDGRMFFHLTRAGRAVRKRRYIFTETFGVAALAAYAQASGEARAKQEAIDLFSLITRYLTTPGLIPPKVYVENRPSKALAIPMIMIVTAQILREAVNDHAFCNEWIDKSIAEIERVQFLNLPLRA